MSTQDIKIKIALALIVKADDKEAELLDRCLGGIIREKLNIKHKNINLKKTDGLAKYVDGIFITITGENEKCEEVAKKYNAKVSHYKWDYSFANARNFNFNQISEDYKYIIWTDTDDVWHNASLIRNVVSESDKKAIDVVVLKYLYDFDDYGNCIVEHLKTRIIKNDGCVKWVNDIHEDFQENRRLLSYLNNEIKVIHLTDDKRSLLASTRNIYIAELAVQKNPQDPHSYWNLANTYTMSGKYKEAMPIYLKFIEISNSDEERFLSWHRLSNIYKELNDYGRAIESELEALSLRSWYPDAYFSLGELYYKTGKLRNAQEMVEMGFTKKIPEVESIVWNPLDYTYNPAMLLAKIYLEANKPREAIKKLKVCLRYRPKDKSIKKAINDILPEIRKFDFAENVYKKAKKLTDKNKIKELLDSVPTDMIYYPPIVYLRNTHFIKETSSGKDLVILCSYTEHEWNANTANTNGVGGSEESVIQLSKRFVSSGYNVTVYANTPQQQESVIDGVSWKPYMAWNYKDKQDIVILWRHPKFLDFDINSNKVYVDIHDVVPPAEFTKDRILKVTKFLFKSHVHRKYYPNIPDNKCEVIPHGLDIAEFDDKRYLQRDPYRILNTSSPDRGLKTCIKIIKLVYDKLPGSLKSKLKFAQYYGFNVWDAEFQTDRDMMKWKEDAIKQMDELKRIGIMEEDSGKKISQRQVTTEYLRSGMLLYPSNFFEIGFISGMKAMLAGCIPLTTDVFAQGEFVKGIKIHSDTTYDNWIKDLRSGTDYGVDNIEEVSDKIVEYVTQVDKYEPMRQELINYAKQYTWDKTASGWIDEFSK